MAYNLQMLILSVDTSSPSGGAALLQDETVVSESLRGSAKWQSARIFREVEEILERGEARMADVELFAVCVGPGSFTGLRVGLTAVKAWAEVWGRPVAAVSGLEAVAALATEPAKIRVPMLDARRGQVYAGLYARLERQAYLSRVGEEVVLSPEEFFTWMDGQREESPLIVSPSGEAILAIVSAAGRRSLRMETVTDILAGMIGRLGFRKAKRGEAVDALRLDASYIRRSDAELNWKESA